MNPIHFKNIVCFGEVLWDMIPDGAKPGGAPMNVAIHLKKLGLEPHLVSRVGKDNDGAALMAFLNDEGLATDFLQEDADLPTSKVLVQLDENGNASYEICKPVAWDNIQYSAELGHLADEAGLIIFGTLASRNKVTRATLLRMLEQTHAVKLLDVNLRPPYDDQALVGLFLQMADFVKLNDDELHQVAEWYGKSGPVHELTTWLSQYFDCRVVCVTRGSAGALLLMDNKIVEHPGYKVQTVDTVGAGDAFLAALVAGLSNDKSPENVLAFASATGAFVASRSGAVPSYTADKIKAIFNV